MRFAGPIALLVAGATAFPAWAIGEMPMEQQVLTALNDARTHPGRYAASLREFRRHFRGAVYRTPGARQSVMTNEGTGAVDESIAFVSRQAPLRPVGTAEPLARSAATLVADEGVTGDVGHDGRGEAALIKRARRAGKDISFGEVIAYGPVDGADAVRQLVVDDGVADRGHRNLIFSPDVLLAGASCGPHKQYRTMCVVDFALATEAR